MISTPEQWEQYERELESHNAFIQRYRFYLDRICNHLDSVRKDNKWTTEDIRKVMTSEIDMAAHCGAPNKPGYYRANND